MTTERQSEYLRDLGIDPRVDLSGIGTRDASEWIDELEGYVRQAGIPVGTPLDPTVLARLGARSDALAQPPGRSIATISGGPSGRPAAPPPLPEPRGEFRGRSLRTDVADEAWLKVELSASVTTPMNETAFVTVSASAHHRHGPTEVDGEELGRLVRRLLEREIARVEREYIGEGLR